MPDNRRKRGQGKPETFAPFRAAPTATPKNPLPHVETGGFGKDDV